MGNKDKDKEHSKAEGAETATAKEAHNACQSSRVLSHEREDALSRQITEAIAKEAALVTVHFQAILNERTALSLASSLKITSRAESFQVMTPFD